MLIDGRELAQQVLDNLLKRVDKLHQEKKITPQLGIVLVGNDPASESYVKQKIRMAHQIHADATLYKYPDAISQKELLAHIAFLQQNKLLHGLIIQLPLPENLDEETLINAVDNDLDVDGFKENSQFKEPIALAVFRILQEVFDLKTRKKLQNNSNLNNVASSKYHVVSNEDFLNWLKLQSIVIMGKGKTGGKPIIKWLREEGVEYKVIDSKTENPSTLTNNADILICCVGNRGILIHDGNIKKDAILIGIGMHKGTDGKLHGDYDPDEIKDKAGYFTPIPGGVGPLNAAMLLVNVVESAERFSSSRAK